jgi:anti-sigma factor RsiW
MTVFGCAAARRRLQAYHDGELPVGDQIAVAAHVDRCRACAETLAELRTLTSVMRSVGGVRRGLTREQAAAFQSAVVSRAKAERDASFIARVRGMFDDLHLVYAGFGAAMATTVCLIIMVSMMRFATSERPDSLAAMVAVLATPGSSADAIVIDAASHARWTARFQAANETAEQDAVFALAAVVTREGRIADLERLRARSHKSSASDDAKLIEGLLDAVSRARLEGAPVDGVPSASSILGLVTRTTVRATSGAARTLDLVLPAVKKRIATERSWRSAVSA